MIRANLLLAIVALPAFADDSPVVSAGPYRVELRVPPEGIFAGEEIDIEFRVSDPRQDDPIQGPAGVPNCTIVGTVTMPEMAGMPAIRPKIHREGVPGDYGITVQFPHGGAYKIQLEITPTGSSSAVNAAFTVEVKDESPASSKKPKPFVLALANSRDWIAGVSKQLTLNIVKTATKETVKDFDTAHERKFHLLIARSDFGWFLHEHPEQQPDGSWRVDLNLPSGGKYLLFADVAPIGFGSMILANSLTVSGATAPAASWALQNSSVADEVRGQLGAPSGLPVGRSVPISVRLTDADGKPITDIQPWLGAMGHLMIFSQDGLTAVHSHPADEQMVKPGEITFNARFPKAAKYRAFCQVQRGGVIKTLTFTIEVKP